jgi:hypothetical protein
MRINARIKRGEARDTDGGTGEVQEEEGEK